MLALALFDHIDKEERFTDWIEASIRYLLAQQHQDGSFDEWYPNERGWAGPTGYLIYALAKTWSLVGDRLSLGLREEVFRACERSCRFLSRYEEIDVLSNHQAMALLAIAQTRAVFQEADVTSLYEALFQRFNESVSAEGWSLEYDGADPGYQSATLSFLARVHSLNGDARIETMVAPMLEFVSCFFFGEKSFGGTPGSRSTRNVFHFGLEYWAHRFKLAETLAVHSRKMLEAGTLLDPADQEDHYLIYRLPELLEASLIARPDAKVHGILPYAQTDFRRWYQDAGILAQRFDGAYVVVNAKKGGALKALLANGKVVEDSGWVLRRAGNRLATCSYVRSDRKIEFHENHVLIRGPASRISHPLFNVWTFMAFRLAMKSLGFVPGLARKMKAWIRSKIMTGHKADQDIQFTRMITFRPNLVIRDTILCARPEQVERIWWGGSFVTRMVPQSRYFEEYELTQRPQIASGSRLEMERTLG